MTYAMSGHVTKIHWGMDQTRKGLTTASEIAMRSEYGGVCSLNYHIFLQGDNSDLQGSANNID